MNTAARTLIHRLRQARTAALRLELAMTGVQILFWVALTGAVSLGVVYLWRAPRRREVSVGDSVGNPESQAVHKGEEENG